MVSEFNKLVNYPPDGQFSYETIAKLQERNGVADVYINNDLAEILDKYLYISTKAQELSGKCLDILSENKIDRNKQLYDVLEEMYDLKEKYDDLLRDYQRISNVISDTQPIQDPVEASINIEIQEPVKTFIIEDLDEDSEKIPRATRVQEIQTRKIPRAMPESEYYGRGGSRKIRKIIRKTKKGKRKSKRFKS